MTASAIEIRGLEKSFEPFRLGPLNLTVPRGAIYGFIGPNGAGKTTTIDLIFGMGHPDAGTIRVLGMDHQSDEVAMKRRHTSISRMPRGSPSWTTAPIDGARCWTRRWEGWSGSDPPVSRNWRRRRSLWRNSSWPL